MDMRVNKKIVLLIAALPFLCSSPVFGEVLTLREAVGRALENNRQPRAAKLQEGAAREDLAVSRSRYLPRLYLESSAALSTTPSTVFMMKLDEGRINPGSDFAAGTLNRPAARGDFGTALTLSQPLLDPGVSTGVQLAAKDAEAASLSLLKSREQVAYRVYLAYLEVRKARAYREIADQALADAGEHGRLAGVREKDGLGLKSDRLRAQTALSEAEQRLVTVRNDLLLARLRLNLVLGGPAEGTVDIGEIPELREPPADLAALAQSSRPELKVAEKAVEKGDLLVRQARNAYLPTVYANAGYQVNDRDLPLGFDNDSWHVGVNLRWELFDGGSRSHGRQKAELSRKAAAELLDDERRDVALGITESALRRQEAALRLASARAALEAAGEGARLTTLRFRNGLSSMVELMDAESVLNRSRANLVEVENALLASTGELYYQAGLFLKEVMR